MTEAISPPKKALEIFPLEVWAIMFDNLESPTDVASCYRTCKDWVKLLEPKRTSFLMPEVFPLIVKYLTVEEEKEDDDDEKEEKEKEDDDDEKDQKEEKEKEDDDDEKDQKDEKEEDEDDVSDDNSDWEDVDDDDSDDGSEEEKNDRNLIPNPILSSRVVCKSWKNAVDIFLQNHPSHTNIDFPTTEEILDPCKTITALPIKHYQFNSHCVDELENFVKTKFPPNCNPILTRYVEYSEPIAYDREGRLHDPLPGLRSAFNNLLLLHGTHIWHISLSMKFPRRSRIIDEKINHFSYNYSNAYNLFNRYLSLMPNLKTLNVPFNIGPSPYFGFELHRTTPALEQLLDSNPLPTFEQLTTLKMKDLPPNLEKGLLLKNSHVQKLSWLSQSIAVSAPWILELQMNNLEEFATKVYREEDLHTLQSLSWPFKKLALRSKSLPLHSIFRAISVSPFANNLKHLTVYADGDEDFNKTTGKLELPNLITFRLRADTKLKNIDFLLPTSASLCNLQIEMIAKPTRSMTTRSMKKDVGNATPNQVVQFHGYVPTMLESNIWNHFPKLKRLKIVVYDPDYDPHIPNYFLWHDHLKNEKYVYTRAAWEKFVANQSK